MQRRCLRSADGRGNVRRVRLFETYPPSVVPVALVALTLTLIGGAALVVPYLIGVALMALCQRLDFYGAGRSR